MVSLFPKATWKGRADGLRADLVQLLKDLQPGFLRFPGGCIVEGRNLQERYQWKTTIGDPAERKLIINRWNLEFRARNPARAPDDYFQSFGLGFFEYFQLCEDVGAEPLPILNCGMACQFNTGELAPLDQLDPYIQDALDLIEFANGSAATAWGRKRAELGHPAPFNMKLLGVGNEQWGPDDIPRYEAFAKAIKAKYPNITTMASYAPLFGHVDAWQWSPNLIWFDNLRSFGTPSYYVQKLFSQHRGADILPVLLNGSVQNGQQQLYASAVLDARRGEVILKLVNTAATAAPVRIHLAGLAGAGKVAKPAQSIVLASDDLKTENSLPPQSLTVLRVAFTK